MNTEQNLSTFYIVRHGQAESNVNKIVAGFTDAKLTENGEKQAEARREEFAGIKFDAVFASDLSRARRTAEIISAERQLAVNTRELLKERNFGDWEGRKEDEVRMENKHLFEKLEQLEEKEKLNFKYNPGFESDQEIATRMLTVLRELAVTYEGKTVLVVSHGSIMRALLTRLGFASYDELQPGCIENTGYIKLESDGVDFFVRETKGIKKTSKVIL